MSLTNKYLLDTSVAVAIMRGDAHAASFLSASPETYLCDVVVGELYFGAYRSDRREANLQRVAEFISRFEVICGSLRAAQEYGILKARLQAEGSLIPENDLWVAAIAIAHQLVLVSRDNHFRRVPELSLVQW